MNLRDRSLFAPLIVTLILYSSASGQWEAPAKPITYLSIPARLIVMTHGHNRMSDMSRYNVPMAISRDGTKLAVASKPDRIPIGPEGDSHNEASVLNSRANDGWRRVSVPSTKRGSIVRSVPTSGHIGIFDVATGDCIARLCDADNPENHYLLWSQDGETLVALGETGDGTRRTVIWNATTSTIQAIIPGQGPIALSPNGNHLLVRVDVDDEVFIHRFDAKSGQLTAKIKGDDQLLKYQRGLAYSPDGKYFAAGFCIWDAATGEIAFVPPSQNDENSVPLWFTPDAASLASGLLGARFCVQRVGAGNRRYIFSDADLKESPLGKSQLVSDLEKHRFDDEIQASSKDLTLVAVVPDEDDEDKAEVQAWLYSLETGGMLAKLTAPDDNADLRCVAISTDNRTVAASRDDGATLLWDISDVLTQVRAEGK